MAPEYLAHSVRNKSRSLFGFTLATQFGSQVIAGGKKASVTRWTRGAEPLWIFGHSGVNAHWLVRSRKYDVDYIVKIETIQGSGMNGWERVG